jgi:hypothetical protein
MLFSDDLLVNHHLWLVLLTKYEMPMLGHSASARISKGQGYQGFLRKRAGSSFGQKGQFAL